MYWINLALLSSIYYRSASENQLLIVRASCSRQRPLKALNSYLTSWFRPAFFEWICLPSVVSNIISRLLQWLVSHTDLDIKLYLCLYCCRLVGTLIAIAVIWQLLNALILVTKAVILHLNKDNCCKKLTVHF